MDDAATHVLVDLDRERPQFHSLPAEAVGSLAAVGFSGLKAGNCSWNVSWQVLEWIAEHLTPEMVTAETGAGYTTVLCAALGRQHFCHTLIASETERITAYLAAHRIPPERVRFSIGPSELTLPQIPVEAALDFAFVDGCHGYPYPAMDWHFLDQRLRVGGLLGMDNAEIRPVREHCDFLETNGSYERIDSQRDSNASYETRWYRKIRHEPSREWICQPFSRARSLAYAGRSSA